MQQTGLSTHVRAATFQDAATIAELLAELAWHEQSGVHYHAENLSSALASTQVGLQALIAWQESNPVGVLLYYPGYDVSTHSYGFHLADMVVRATHRRQGIAKALMRGLCNDVLAQSFSWISLTRLQNNAEAKAYYDALGFQEMPVAFHAIGTQGIKKIVGK